MVASDFWDDYSRQASFLDLWEETVIVLVIVALLMASGQTAMLLEEVTL